MVLQGDEMAKIGRNDSCFCGSGKKYKKCCERIERNMIASNMPPPGKKKLLTQLGLNRCLLKLVKDAGGSIDVSCSELGEMPRDEMLSVRHNEENDSFHFESVKVKQEKILQPNKRLILPN